MFVFSVPLQTYALIGFLSTVSIGFTNVSLKFLNYPTQIIFKSCKLIPVMVGGIIIQKKKYGVAHFLSAALMSVGLCFFVLADSKTSPIFDKAGNE